MNDLDELRRSPRWLDAACHRRGMGERGGRRERGGGRRVAPFTPAAVSGLAAWYRDVYAGGTWSDLSGNGRHLTQATGTSRPTQVTRAGQLALSFDGGDFVKATFGATIAQPLTIYCVAETSAVDTTRALFDGATALKVRVDTVTTGWRMLAGALVGGGAVSAGTIYGLSTVFNGASSALYTNNFVTAAATGDPGANGIDGITAGAAAGGTTAQWIGYIWELILYTGAHNAATRKQIGDYLTARYSGLTVTT